jgi:hypothetical protein
MRPDLSAVELVAPPPVRFELTERSGDVRTVTADGYPWSWRSFLCWRVNDRVTYFPMDQVDNWSTL